MAICTCIKLKTVDQRLTIVQQPVLASGDVGTVRVEYALDSYWDGYVPSGTFYTGKQPEDVYEQPLSGGACVIPWEVLQEDGVLYIGLRGVDAAGLVKTAAPVRYRVEKGSPCGNGTAVEPTPDVYQQILAVAGNAESIAQSVRDDADAGVFDAYTPVRGKDYWTESDVNSINEHIAKETAKYEQLKPEFANSLSECTDTSKLYVLPDGLIYAYMYVPPAPLYTNRLPLATETDGNTIFNDGLGYIDGYRLNTSGVQTTCGGMMTSGYMPVKYGDIIRIKGVGQTTTSYAQITAFYDAQKAHLACNVGLASIEATNVAGVTIANGIITINTANIKDVKTDMAFFRCAFGDLTNAIITVNEEIIDGTSPGEYVWSSTGHEFVPADYEDRIVSLEDGAKTQNLRLNTHEVQIKALEKSIAGRVSSAIPDYWEDAVSAAETKITALQDAGGVDCVQFVWASDTHCTTNQAASGSYSTAVNVGRLADRLMGDLSIPFFAVTGDLAADVGGAATYPDKTDIDAYFTNIVDPVGKDRVLHVLGNHDGTTYSTSGDRTLSKEVRFNWFMRPFCAVGQRIWGGGEYYYADHKQGKTRFIALCSNNLTADTRYRQPHYDGTQLKWLAENALDVPNGYTVVILTHFPSNGTELGGSPANADVMQAILAAFDARGTYSGIVDGVEITADYTNIDAVMCGVFAGHTHEDAIDTSLGYPVVTIDCAGNKTAAADRTFTNASDQETLLDVVTINKATRTIYLTRLGVGEDRTVTY